MITRAKHGIFKPKKLFHVTKHPLPPAVEPSTALQALKDPLWHQAMVDELSALSKNNTWELVPPTSKQNVVSCKWVFRIKRKADGAVE